MPENRTEFLDTSGRLVIVRANMSNEGKMVINVDDTIDGVNARIDLDFTLRHKLLSALLEFDDYTRLTPYVFDGQPVRVLGRLVNSVTGRDMPYPVRIVYANGITSAAAVDEVDGLTEDEFRSYGVIGWWP